MINKKPVDISVIIVSYNNEAEIEHCLSSLIQATNHLSAQIILIDNYSHDQTVHRIQTMCYNIMLIQNKKNIGFTKAVNQGLKRSHGKFILLLNPDTELPVDIFTKLFPMFEQDAPIGIIAPQFLNSDKSIQPSCRRLPRQRDVFFHALGLNRVFPRSKFFNGWKMGDFDHQSERFVEQPQGAFLLTTRQAFSDVGLLDEQFPMFFSDVDWCHRYKCNGWKILFTPSVQIIHAKGSSVYKNRIPLIWSSHLSFYRYFKKYDITGRYPLVNLATGFLLIILACARTVYALFKK